jgi:hypothetical protein
MEIGRPCPRRRYLAAVPLSQARDDPVLASSVRELAEADTHRRRTAQHRAQRRLEGPKPDSLKTRGKWIHGPFNGWGKIT